MDIDAEAANAASKHDEGVLVHISDAKGKPAYYEKDGEQVPITIRIAGSMSRKYKQIESAQRNQKLKPKALTTAALQDQVFDRIVACTLEWDGIQIGGQMVPFSAKNVEMIYRKASWIYDDMNEACHDNERFFDSGSTQPANG